MWAVEPGRTDAAEPDLRFVPRARQVFVWMCRMHVTARRVTRRRRGSRKAFSTASYALACAPSSRSGVAGGRSGGPWSRCAWRAAGRLVSRSPTGGGYAATCAGCRRARGSSPPPAIAGCLPRRGGIGHSARRLGPGSLLAVRMSASHVIPRSPLCSSEVAGPSLVLPRAGLPEGLDRSGAGPCRPLPRKEPGLEGLLSPVGANRKSDYAGRRLPQPGNQGSTWYT